MRMNTVVALAGAALAAMLLAAGCSGGNNGQAPISSGGSTAGATYVGTAECETCHTDEGAGFSKTAHGQDFSQPVHGINFMTFAGGACQYCHTVGKDEVGGFTTPTATPQLIGIGCEDCHGPGSKHVAAPSVSNINAVPQASSTCWNCHVDEYKTLQHNPGEVYDADLVGTLPSKVSGPHHPQTLELLGVEVADIAVTPSPHSVINNTCVACHLNPDQGNVVIDPTITGTYGNLTIPSGANPIHGQGALAVDAPTCVPCHGSEAAAKSLYTSHKTEFITDLEEIGGTSGGAPDTSCSGGMLANFASKWGINDSSDPSDPHVMSYKAARWNYEYLISDMSNGTHNPTLADIIIADCKARLSVLPPTP